VRGTGRKTSVGRCNDGQDRPGTDAPLTARHRFLEKKTGKKTAGFLERNFLKIPCGE